MAAMRPPLRSGTRSKIIAVLLMITGFTGICAYYFFDYVPGRSRYFLELQFRTLSVIGGQLSSKVESLDQAFDFASSLTPTPEPLRTHEYLHLLIPDLYLGGSANASESLLFKGGQLEAYASWPDLVRTAIPHGLGKNFRDLLIVDLSNHVLFQYNTLAPQILQIDGSEIVKAPTIGQSKKSRIPANNGAETDQSSNSRPFKQFPEHATTVHLEYGGQTVSLLISPFRIKGTRRLLGQKEFFLAGIVSDTALEHEARKIPIEKLALPSLPFLLILIIIPFLKLFSLSPLDGYRTRDVFLLAWSSAILFAIPALMLASSNVHGNQTDKNLEMFANKIDSNVGREFAAWHNVVTFTQNQSFVVQEHLSFCKITIKGLGDRSCGLWKTLKHLLPGDILQELSAIGGMRMDVFFWTNRAGMQIRKWSAKTQLTAPITIATQEHFEKVLTGQLWHLRQNPEMQFVVQPLRSPTTSDMAFAFTIPVDSNKDDTKTIPVAITMNAQPLALVDAVIPPEYGFAVVAPDGTVLFHSEEERSLHENLLAETSNRDELERAIVGANASIWDSDYRGEPYRFYAAHMRSIVGSSWTLVTFRKQEPLLGFAIRQQIVAALLVLAELTALCFLLFAVYQFKNRKTVKNASVLSLLWRWRQSTPLRHWFLVVVLLILAAAGAVALFRCGSADYSELDLLFYGFIIVPIVVIVSVVLIGAGPNRNRTKNSGRFIAAEWCLLLLVAASIPAAGIGMVVYRIEDNRRLTDWLAMSSSKLNERENLLVAQTGLSRNLDKETTEYLLELVTKDRIGGCRKESVWCYLDVLREMSTESSHAVGVAAPELFSEKLLNALWATAHAWHADFDVPKSGLHDQHIQLLPSAERIMYSETERQLNHISAVERRHPRPNSIWLVVAVPFFVSVIILIARTTRRFFGEEFLSRQLSIPHETDIKTLLRRKRDNIFIFGPLASDTSKLLRNILEEESKQVFWLSVQDFQTLQASSRHDEHGSAHCCDSKSIIVLTVSRDLWGDDMLASKLTGFLEQWSDDRQNGDRQRLILVCDFSVRSLIEEKFSLTTTAPLRRFYEASTHFVHVYPYYCLDQTRRIFSLADQGILACSEAGSFLTLALMGKNVERLAKERGWGSEKALAFFGAQANGFYQAIWTALSTSEKGTLVHFAGSEPVLPQSVSPFASLLEKGLVRMDPVPRIFNKSFQAFLRAPAQTGEVSELERAEKRIGWYAVRQLSVAGLMCCIALYLFSGGHTVESLVAIFTASGLLTFPRAKMLLENFGSK